MAEQDAAEEPASSMSVSYERLQQRDAGAWDAFYQEHVHELYGFLLRLVRGNRPAAADLFQDTWLDAIRHIEQFDPQRGELRAWLFGIARRRIALYWRKRAASDAIGMTVQLDHAACANRDGAVLPDDVIEQVEQAAVVRASLLAMPPDRREALTDKYIEGLSVGQIAAKTGKSPKSVESQLARAREELRSLLRWYFSSPKGEKGAQT
jgi:RNA polymerase sigma-70 factor (ECF subfamily)